jgi:hypothetical protein
MTALEDQLRAAVHGYDTAVAGHRPLGMAEGLLPGRMPPPYGPDVLVFGSPDGPDVRGEPSWPSTGCPVHQVGWYGPGPCWCCEAGVKPCR